MTSGPRIVARAAETQVLGELLDRCVSVGRALGERPAEQLIEL